MTLQQHSLAPHSTGLLLAAVVVCALFLPRTVTEGQFVDGMTYASVSRNLAEGYGTCWQPWGSVWFGQQVFYEHPPLLFWVQSLFFRAFGDVWWVDKLFCTLVLLGTLAAMRWVWGLLFGDDEQRRPFFWLAVLLWYLTPTVSWGMPCNMLEGPLTLLSLCAVGCSLKATRPEGWPWLLGCGLLVGFGFLIKGPVALFPLAAPFISLFCFREAGGLSAEVSPKARAEEVVAGHRVFRAGLPALVFVAAFGLLMLHTPARDFFQHYWHHQVLLSLSGGREMGGAGFAAHFFLLKAFFTAEGLPALGISAALFFLGKMLGKPTEAPHRRTLFALLIFAAATLPLLVSIKQRSYYLMPAMPWLAFALAAWAAPCAAALGRFFLENFLQKTRWALWASVVGIALFSLSQMGRVGRDMELIQVLHQMRGIVQQGVTVGVCPETYRNSTPVAYLYRYGRWEPSAEQGPLLMFALVDESHCAAAFGQGLSQRGFVESIRAGHWVLFRR